MFQYLLPLQLVLLILPSVYGQASQAPPSTFGSVTSAPSSSGSGGSTISLSSTATSTASFPNLSGYSECVTMCLSESVSQANCTSIVQPDCYCSKREFSNRFPNCINTSCASELQTAEQLAESFCGRATNSTSVSFPSPTATSTSSATTTSNLPGSSTSPTAPAASSSAPNAAAILRGTGFGTWFGTAATIIGVALGAILLE